MVPVCGVSHNEVSFAQRGPTRKSPILRHFLTAPEQRSSKTPLADRANYNVPLFGLLLSRVPPRGRPPSVICGAPFAGFGIKPARTRLERDSSKVLRFGSSMLDVHFPVQSSAKACTCANTRAIASSSKVAAASRRRPCSWRLAASLSPPGPIIRQSLRLC